LDKSATEQRALHGMTFKENRVSVLASPTTDATSKQMVEKPNGQLPGDVVLEEARSYGEFGSKIATLAALHRVPGARAEIALLSLSRAYLSNCYARDGAWTAGVHLAFWTLEVLTREPTFEATDLRGPFTKRLEVVTAIASWTLISFRLALLTDVAERARMQKDGPMSRVKKLVLDAIEAPPTRPDRLLARLRRDRRKWNAVLSYERYRRFRESLHQD
jgi:hypothetical protein